MDCLDVFFLVRVWWPRIGGRFVNMVNRARVSWPSRQEVLFPSFSLLSFILLSYPGMFIFCVLIRPRQNHLLFFKNLVVSDDLYSVSSQYSFRYVYTIYRLILTYFFLRSVIVVLPYPVGWPLICLHTTLVIQRLSFAFSTFHLRVDGSRMSWIFSRQKCKAQTTLGRAEKSLICCFSHMK